MFQKILFEGTLREPAWWAGRTTVEIWATACLPYLLMSLKAIGLEKIRLADMESLKTVFQRIDKSPVSKDTWTSRLDIGNKHC